MVRFQLRYYDLLKQDHQTSTIWNQYYLYLITQTGFHPLNNHYNSKNREYRNNFE